ncbi:MAG TPA: M20/M25/M40 family metallo-hydrolase [Pyrinomonadaceae bacterium]|nr:M20/M25/M40 family metallo-hydrolase [Pyrinomonadaceae bacterium]
MAASLFIAVVAYLSIALVRPPEVVPETAPPGEFSAARATRRLREFARKPHPTGTEENARVRDYIVRELTALGLSPEVQLANVVVENRGARGAVRAAAVRNVVARLEGSANSKALMLAAHYDSVPTGPGASDDGAGVAALLETLRALKAGPRLRNDLIFLFTDGEELGLLGAHGFAAEHPWMRDVGLVLNFEARGAGGPSFMFETSEANGLLIEELARSAPHVAASSLMYAVYKRMPNDTDMTVFKAAGASGLNFAYVGRVTSYHTELDSVDELDARSLQHHGSYALTLARSFGNLDLRETRARDAVYFNAFGNLFIHYTEAWVVPLTILITLVLVSVIVYGLKRRRLTIRGIVSGFLALFSCGVVAWLLLTALGASVRVWHDGYRFLPSRTPYNAGLFELGFVLVGIAATAALYVLFFRRVCAQDLAAGALVWWLILLLAVTLALPLGSYLFAWPLLFSSLGLAFICAGGERRLDSWKSLAALSASAIPALVLVAPLTYMLFMLLGLELAAYFMILPVLLAGLLVPHIRLMTLRNGWLLPASAALIGLGLVAAGLATAGFDARRRKTNSVFYSLNADTNLARWASADATPDEWTSQFITAGARRESLASIFPWSSQAAWQQEAPSIDAPAPAVEILEDLTNADVRRLRLRIVSQRRAPLMLVHADATTEVLRAFVNGKPTRSGETGSQNSSEGGFRLSYAAPPPEGLELLLEIRAASTLKLSVRDVSYELPEIPEHTYKPRPAYMMPAPSFGMSDTTVVGKTFSL